MNRNLKLVINNGNKKIENNYFNDESLNPMIQEKVLLKIQENPIKDDTKKKRAVSNRNRAIPFFATLSADRNSFLLMEITCKLSFIEVPCLSSIGDTSDIRHFFKTWMNPDFPVSGLRL